MADKIPQLILNALQRAAAEPAGLPLQAGRNAPGLFPTNPQARQAAQLCKDEGYLRVVRTETKGKSKRVQEICALSQKGLAFLLGQLIRDPSLRFALGDFLRAQETDPSNGSARNGSSLPGETVAKHAPTIDASILTCLSQWQTVKSLQDCPLPELYRRSQKTLPHLSVGTFHDGLRRLHDSHKLLLHPWTGPLYDLPEPAFALLAGHEVAYYASIFGRVGGES